MGLDAFGTDRRPAPELDAAVSVAGQGLALELIGDRAALEHALDARGLAPELRAAISIAHASEQIGMDESPSRAVRAKPDASLCVAIDRLAAHELDAVVSAGNSGAILAAALLRLGRLPGLDRPAIATRFPWADHPRGYTVLLDVGANVECKVLNMVQFAVIGATYSKIEAGVARPRVAVLANGAEAIKGTALTRETHEILSQAADANFEYVGYVEPAALFASVCDVAVTDGWTGNVALKLAEGAMGAWPQLLRRALRDQADDAKGERAIAAAIEPALQTVSQRVDPDAHGGAPLLGVDGAVMICHGAAGPRALHNALLAAQRLAEGGLTLAIGSALAKHRELFELARNRPDR